MKRFQGNALGVDGSANSDTAARFQIYCMVDPGPPAAAGLTLSNSLSFSIDTVC